MKTLLILIPMLAMTSLFAQRGTVSAGGNATAANGSVSYSIGQVDYLTVTGSNGTVTQGLQQPYEIFVVGIDDNKDITMEVSAYPNPALHQVSVKAKNLKTEDLSYHLYDLEGRLLFSLAPEGEVTIITVNDLPSAAYILKVNENQQVIKTFKIIKK